MSDSSEIDVNPIRAARAAAFDAARREVKGGSAIDAEAVIAIVEAAIKPLAEAVVKLTAAIRQISVAAARELLELSPEEIEESKRVRELAALFERSFSFAECTRFARYNGGAEPGKYLPNPIAYPDAAAMIAGDLLRRVEPAKLLRALIDERPRRAAEIRSVMPYVSDAELTAVPKKGRR